MATSRQLPQPVTSARTILYLAVRQSAYAEHPLPLMLVDINYADALNMWAQEKCNVRSIEEASTLQSPSNPGPDKEDLSSKRPCQQCRKSRIRYDRQRPCQRCKDADIGADGYFDEKDWARDNYVAPNDHLTEAHTEEKFVHSSSFVWLESYKRPMKLTLRCPDYLSTETELDVLAADDVESVVQAAMQADAERTAEAKQARLDMSHMYNGMYQPNRTAVMIEGKTKKKYWWNLIGMQTMNLQGEIEGRRMPSEQEGEEREWLGQIQWREDEELGTNYVEQGQDEIIDLNGLDLVEVTLEDETEKEEEVSMSLYESLMLGYMNRE